MHELALMQELLPIALEKARTGNASRIHVIRLRIGRLSGVVPEALQFAFQTLSENTPAAGAKLEVELVPVVCYCAACKTEFEAPGPFCECPACGTLSAEIRQGRELEIKNMEIS